MSKGNKPAESDVGRLDDICNYIIDQTKPEVSAHTLVSLAQLRDSREHTESAATDYLFALIRFRQDLAASASLLDIERKLIRREITIGMDGIGLPEEIHDFRQAIRDCGKIMCDTYGETVALGALDKPDDFIKPVAAAYQHANQLLHTLANANVRSALSTTLQQSTDGTPDARQRWQRAIASLADMHTDTNPSQLFTEFQSRIPQLVERVEHLRSQAIDCVPTKHLSSAQSIRFLQYNVRTILSALHLQLQEKINQLVTAYCTIIGCIPDNDALNSIIRPLALITFSEERVQMVAGNESIWAE